MNEICVALGNNFKDVNNFAIKLIDYKNLNCQNIIIIPDRFSLLMEKQIFNTLNISSTINISVMGISRFANSVFEKLNLDFEFVTKQESLLIVRKAIMNTQNKLKCFLNEITTGLCEELFNAITQLKSNEISFLDIEKIKENLNFNEFSDIAIIFEEYERLLGEKLDSTKILTYLEDAILKMNFNEFNFFFLNFDSLTKQGYSILKALAKTAKGLTVGVLQPELQNNAFIFENDIFEKIKLLSASENFSLKILKVPCTLKGANLLIHKNLYSLNIDKNNFDIKDACDKNISFDLIEKNNFDIKKDNADIDNNSNFENNFDINKSNFKNKDFLQIFEANDIDDEVLELSRKINYLIKSEKVEFKNIAVACGNLESYAEQIEADFENFGFSFFMDSGKKLFETLTVRYLINILNLFRKNFSLDLIESFVINEFTEILPEQKNLFLNYVLKFDIHSENLFKKFSEEDIEIIKNQIFKDFMKINALKNNCKTGSDFIKLIIEVLNTFKIFEKNKKIIEKFKSDNLLKEEKLYLQIPEKILQTLNSFEKVLGFEKLKFTEFLELFEDGLKKVEISTVPISVNSIFIGDATNSFFEEVDYLFVIGANEGVMPRTLNDTGIISDEVIKKLESSFEISPSVRMINRRNRFKIFNLLLQPIKKMFISYCLTSDNKEKLLPSSFVFSLQEIFSNVKVFRTSDYFYEFEIIKNEKELCENFAYFCISPQNAMYEILKLNFAGGFNKNVLNSMFFVLRNNLKNYDYLSCFKIEKNQILELYFKNHTTSVSKIEKYYACPFKHFSADVLKLREQNLAEITPADSGNFLHKFAEEFLKPENNFINIIKKTDEIDKAKTKQVLNEVEVKTKSEKVLNELKTNDLNINEESRIVLKQVTKNLINKIKQDKKFYKLNLKINKNATAILEKECLRLCEFLYYSQLVSKFKPTYFESYFGGKKFPAYEITIGKENFYLTGIVDRIDVYDDMFIIIDYKSGNVNTGGYPEVFYGDKIQIFVYLEIFEKLLNKKGYGAFYFPIKNEYKEEKDKLKEYMMKGKAVDDMQFLSAMDTSVNFENTSSKIFACKLNTSKKLLEAGEKEYSKIYTVSKDVFNNMKTYSIHLIKNALNEILSGEISPSPRQGACKFCSFASLCRYDKNQGFRNSIYEIKKEFFESFNKDEIN